MNRKIENFCLDYIERVSTGRPNVVILEFRPAEVAKINNSDAKEHALLKEYVGGGNFMEFRDPSIAVAKSRVDTVHAILGRMGLSLEKA